MDPFIGKVNNERLENIVRKGENTGYQYFLFCSQCSI